MKMVDYRIRYCYNHNYRVGCRYEERGRDIVLVWESFGMGEDRFCWTSLDGLRRGMSYTLVWYVWNFTFIRILIANELLIADQNVGYKDCGYEMAGYRRSVICI
eukprot:TRINITY_DN10284_c0_g1_i1.p1 TRINITY_DN10284_c0_g1~~TRINITY_DN10284_c0_g1_i1.p1  ORF type:complete len:104 (-),score=2.14 TRINITY_DN10284_c0_g1_i1:101-412(-)